MLRNWNLTNFDTLTSLSSNMTAQTLLMNEHLKKQTNHVFCLNFSNSNLKVIFSHFILNIKKKLFHIWNLHKLYILNNFFLYIHDCQKRGKSNFQKKITFYETNLTLYFFCVFIRTTQNKSSITKWPVVEQRQDQHEVDMREA